MANESSNLIYIIGLLYSLIIIGIAMYIISKANEQTSRCNYLKNKDVPPTLLDLEDVEHVDTENLRSLKLTSVDNVGELKIDGQNTNVNFVFDNIEKSEKWNPTDLNGTSLIENDGKMDITYNVGGKDMQTRLTCNSGSFKIGNETYKVDTNQHTTVISDTPIPGEYLGGVVTDAVFNEVPSYDTEGILLKHPDNDKFCLINPSILDNYTAGVEDPIDEEKRGYLKKNTKYTPECLINYHLKTAYNCCAINTTRNSFVNECALKYCLDDGARCLDFEIYSVDDRPVVGVSSKSGNTNMKESYNKLPLGDVLDIISDRQHGDPMILHFRIKSDRVELLESVKNALMNSKLSKNMVFNNRNYGHYWSYEHFENQASKAQEPIRNIIKEHIGKFTTMQNVIISLDLTETKWRNNAQNKNITSISNDLTNLWKIVNIMTPHQIETISINKIRGMTASEQGDLRAETKKKLFFVQPDPALPHKDDLKRFGIDIGCQLVAAPLQFTGKKNIIAYKEFFKDVQHKRKEQDLIQDPIY
tara:strand:+ start:2761 stop:4350 length:1590 start_codon:yes stop_codon:yes gene_type:complete